MPLKYTNMTAFQLWEGALESKTGHRRNWAM